MPADLKEAATEAARERGITVTDYVAGLIAHAVGMPERAPTEQEALLPRTA
ncbi:hypothetical protein [Mycobacteroides abscessus]|uniref:hypothetical protein n=1 Tax=Mycobacteroides abscessus TaxID=36809 RepID=UPI001878D004